jgi:hypothetical protein
MLAATESKEKEVFLSPRRRKQRSPYPKGGGETNLSSKATVRERGTFFSLVRSN